MDCDKIIDSEGDGHFIEMPAGPIHGNLNHHAHLIPPTPGPAHTDFRKLVVFKDPASPANIFIAYTPVQPDFATLGSFGSIADVAKTIVPQGRGACVFVLCGYHRCGAVGESIEALLGSGRVSHQCATQNAYLSRQA